jgi:hypothetical protein
MRPKPEEMKKTRHNLIGKTVPRGKVVNTRKVGARPRREKGSEVVISFIKRKRF